MVKTRGGHAFRPRVRSSSPPPAAAPPVALAVAATSFATAATQGSPAVGSFSDAPAPRRYHAQIGPTPPAPSHPRPSLRAPQSKRARTSGPGESSRSRPAEPQSPPHQGIAGAPLLDLSLASIIKRPYFPYNPIPRNANCSERATCRGSL